MGNSTMNLMCFQNLLDGITIFRMDHWNSCRTAIDMLLDALYLKVEAFNPSDSTNVVYSSFLLRFLDFILNVYQRGNARIPPALNKAQKKIIQRLLDHNEIISPFLCYVENNLLTVCEWVRLHEINVSQEVQHCLLDIRWSPPTFFRDRRPKVAHLELIPPFNVDRMWLTKATEDWLAR